MSASKAGRYGDMDMQVWILLGVHNFKSLRKCSLQNVARISLVKKKTAFLERLTHSPI